jgi:predicted phage tail protein
MTEKPPVDIFSLSREMMSQWEQSVNALLTQHMSTSEFGKQMHESMGSSAQAMKALSKMSGQFSPATKDDVTQINRSLHAIEEQLAEVTSMLQRLLPQDTPARPKRQVSRSKRFHKAAPSKP